MEQMSRDRVVEAPRSPSRSRSPSARGICSLCALIMFLSRVATSCTAASSTADDTTQADESSCGRDVRTHDGATFRLSLPVVLGTGYIWQVEQTPKLMTMRGEPAFSAKTSGQPGLEQLEHFSFRIVGKGSDTLILTYRRPWELATKETKRCRINVVSGQ